MQTKSIRIFIIRTMLIVALVSAFFSCKKDLSKQEKSPELVSNSTAAPSFNLEVVLRSEGNGFGLVKFRQDNDVTKIINLGTWVRGLEPNHSYLLQRAVDPIIPGQCLSTAWLTLGAGLVPQAIYTDGEGTGTADLWRDVSAIASGSSFYIHFQVVDATSLTPVLTSDCYQYTVR